PREAMPSLRARPRPVTSIRAGRPVAVWLQSSPAARSRSGRRRGLAMPLGHCAKRASFLGLWVRPLLIRALEYDQERRQGLLLQIVFGEACRSRRAAK